MIQDFLKTVDTTDPAARCGVHALWGKYLEWLPGNHGHGSRGDVSLSLGCGRPATRSGLSAAPCLSAGLIFRHVERSREATGL